MNAMAQTWKRGAEELGFTFVSPFLFAGTDGKTYTATGYLPHFGGERGTLIVSRFDDEAVAEAGDQAGYYGSGLAPHFYEEYNRARIIETLSDWGWWGPENQVPTWFTGRIRGHGHA
jgi:hypothetical protein